MTDTGEQDYEQLLQDFGAQLDGAVTRLAARRRRRTRTSVGAFAVALAAAGALLLSGGGEHLDVVAQAKAALDPAGEIVHMVTATHIESSGSVGPTSITKQWSASNPTRWRVAFSVPTPTVTPGGKPVRKRDGLITGAMQFSYAAGTEEFYMQQVNSLEVRTGVSERSPRATPSPLGVEPVASVRAMLASGQLRDVGSGTVDGRPVLRLEGRESRGSNPAWPVQYDVDPNTFAPVRVAVEVPRAGRPSSTIVVLIDTYERIPLNAASASLLQIKPSGTPTVRRHHAG